MSIKESMEDIQAESKYTTRLFKILSGQDQHYLGHNGLRNFNKDISIEFAEHLAYNKFEFKGSHWYSNNDHNNYTSEELFEEYIKAII